MAEHEKLGPWVRRFLLEYLVRDRNLARSTQQSYRDTLVHVSALMRAEELAGDVAAAIEAACN